MRIVAAVERLRVSFVFSDVKVSRLFFIDNGRVLRTVYTKRNVVPTRMYVFFSNEFPKVR